MKCSYFYFEKEFITIAQLCNLMNIYIVYKRREFICFLDVIIVGVLIMDSLVLIDVVEDVGEDVADVIDVVTLTTVMADVDSKTYY